MLRAFRIALSVMSPLSPPITSESYFRTLFEASGEAFFVVNEQGQAIDCNDAVLSLHGCQRSDILGTTPLDWSPEFQPNGRRSDEWAAEILSRATAGETVRFEWENRRLDRTPFFVSSTVHRAVIDGLVCYLVVSRDITERRRLEQQLVESEERFRALFEQAPLPYQSLDMGGNIREVNDAWLRLTGETERTRVIGRCITEYLDEASLPTLAESFPRFVQCGHVEGPVFEIRSRDGATRTVTVTGRIARDAQGNPHHTHCILTDITERRRAEEALRASERRFSQLIQNSYDAIVILDADGMQRYVSPSVERMHGYAPAELVDIPVIAQMIHPDDQARVQTAFRQIVETGSGGAQYRHRRKGGGWVCLESFGTNQLANPDIRGVVVNVRDITAQKSVEQALHDSEERLRQTLEHSPNVAVQWYDAQGRVQYWNSASERLYGYAAAEAYGKTLDQLQLIELPEEAQAFRQILADVATRGGSVGPVQFTMRSRSGERQIVLSTLFSIPGHGQHEPLLVCMDIDVTQEQRTAALLERQAAFNRAIIDSEIDGIAACHAIDEPPYMAFSVWNPAMGELTGYSMEEINRLGWYQTVYVDPAIQEMARLRMDRMRQGDHLRAEEWTITRKDGGKRTVQITTSTIIDRAGCPSVLAMMHDITERMRSEAVRDEAMALLQAAIEQSPSGILVADAPDVRIRLANSAALGIRGGESKMLTGIELRQHAQRWQVLLPDGSPCPNEVLPLSRAVRQGETVRGEEFIIRDEAGNEHWISANAAPIRRDNEVVAGIVVFHDISILKEHQRQLFRLAHHDTLTGLPNRALLADRLRQAMVQTRQSGRRMGVILFDLDGFKWINDSVGHDTGDAILIAIAHRLEAVLRRQDTVARLGGDEFVLVVQDVTDIDDVLRVADKALASLREPIEVSGRYYHVSGSAGITLYPDDGNDEQTLIRNADIAMYRAKAAGKNRSHFYAAGMQSEALQRMEMVSGLRQALLLDEFVLHYQPLVDALTGRLEGMEALVCWQHPQRGLVRPAEFIPLAEEFGLIIPIGAFVLREAVRQMRAWEDAGTPVPRVAVNFSALQFRETGLCAMVSNVLAEFGLNADRLTVEITESVLMDDNLVTAASINGLEMLGARLALDDFGTGYSSLSALKRFPVDCVKIDRSFVRDCVEDKEDANLVTAIIHMAHSLNLKVVAEGVETRAQADFLRAQRCDQLQGYLISRPLPANALGASLARGWRHD